MTTRPRIERLPSEVIDQIAAGEVVERPASVVKELVENAVDAGASRLRIELRGGGRDLIAVTDDGIGMTPDEARLALERHATSKLRGLADLESIASFGFRGEALPAIASVSRFRLRTRARGADAGVEIDIEGGVLVAERVVGTSEGTRIEVADLFANVPARRKFLKSAATEWGHVSDWLGRAALALPQVHFDVVRDDHPSLSWPAVADPVERIAAVLGEEDAAALVAAEHDAGPLALRAFVSRPEAHRATTGNIHVFVNGRPVRDRLLRHALLQVYRDVLPRGRFPSAVLFLSVAAGGVDVNVHPAKWEVRFADPQAVYRLLERTLRDALAQRSWLGASLRPAQPLAAGSAPRVFPELAREPSVGDWAFAGARPTAPLVASSTTANESTTHSRSHEAPRFGELRVIGQLLGTYVLLEGRDGLLLVDQHAAHERVLYERLRASWLEGKTPRQALLVPATCELAPAAVAACDRNGAWLAQLGFEVEAFGERSVVLRSVPELFADRDPLPLLRELAEQLASEGESRSARPLDAADRFFATVACHAARRGGDVLPDAELRALMRELDTIPWAPTCPHGRPVATPLSKREIERRFGRV
ncbi:MAG: DNA mismatch repair endonuclease MutL [Deltaproteobacteria bacterium]|nr:DNA mismatch repair endonuclease MutL [Deltaproteobacteria bacterium]